MVPSFPGAQSDLPLTPNPHQSCPFSHHLRSRSRLSPPLLVLGLGLALLALLVLVDLDEPVLLHHAGLLAVPAAALVVAPRALPRARVLVVPRRLGPPLLPRLRPDALARRELLPLGRLLGLRQRLLARQGGGCGGEREQHAGCAGVERQRR